MSLVATSIVYTAPPTPSITVPPSADTAHASGVPTTVPAPTIAMIASVLTSTIASGPPSPATYAAAPNGPNATLVAEPSTAMGTKLNSGSSARATPALSRATYTTPS